MSNIPPICTLSCTNAPDVEPTPKLEENTPPVLKNVDELEGPINLLPSWYKNYIRWDEAIDQKKNAYTAWASGLVLAIYL